MERSRLQRAALQWGGLALVAQLWVALVFVRWAWIGWELARPELVSFAESVDRFSQLKPLLLKYPYAAIYFVAFAASLVALIAALTYRGLREAMAAEPEEPEPDDPTARR